MVEYLCYSFFHVNRSHVRALCDGSEERNVPYFPVQSLRVTVPRSCGCRYRWRRVMKS